MLPASCHLCRCYLYNPESETTLAALTGRVHVLPFENSSLCSVKWCLASLKYKICNSAPWLLYSYFLPLTSDFLSLYWSLIMLSSARKSFSPLQAVLIPGSIIQIYRNLQCLQCRKHCCRLSPSKLWKTTHSWASSIKALNSKKLFQFERFTWTAFLQRLSPRIKLSNKWGGSPPSQFLFCLVELSGIPEKCHLNARIIEKM